ncbi:unnamed protein product, partial [Ectocarpus fasciculatus]
RRFRCYRSKEGRRTNSLIDNSLANNEGATPVASLSPPESKFTFHVNWQALTKCRFSTPRPHWYSIPLTSTSQSDPHHPVPRGITAIMNRHVHYIRILPVLT